MNGGSIPQKRQGWKLDGKRRGERDGSRRAGWKYEDGMEVGGRDGRRRTGWKLEGKGGERRKGWKVRGVEKERKDGRLNGCGFWLSCGTGMTGVSVVAHGPLPSPTPLKRVSCVLE